MSLYISMIRTKKMTRSHGVLSRVRGRREYAPQLDADEQNPSNASELKFIGRLHADHPSYVRASLCAAVATLNVFIDNHMVSNLYG